MERSKVRDFKLKAARYCLIDSQLYWRDPAGIMLKCVDENDAQRIMTELHQGACGGHLYWKSTVDIILRAGYNWPTLFSNVFVNVRACMECHKFAAKNKLFPLPLKPISVSAMFQQWGLDFIGEINPPSIGQHRWIVTTTDYFTKWIEAIPTRNATDAVIIKFMLENIFSRFGTPRKLVIDNAQAFKSIKMQNFCQNYNVILSHSTPYYPQGNGLAKSSDKSLVRIIKKLLVDNKKGLDSKLIFALWADRTRSKKSISTFPFQLFYGVDDVIPVQLALLVMKYAQEEMDEPNRVQRRMLQLIEVHQIRKALMDKAQAYKDKVKTLFDRRTNQKKFQVDDLVLRWDVWKQDKRKHGKFDNLWFGPFKISDVLDNNTFLLKNIDDKQLSSGPINGHILKHFFTY